MKIEAEIRLRHGVMRQRRAELGLTQREVADRAGVSLHIVSGSGYHQSLDTKVHKDMARRFHDYNCKANYYGPVRNIKLTGTSKIINIGHAPSSASANLGSVMEREYINMKVGQATGTIPKVDCVIRGHLHKYRHIDFSDMHIIQVPGWQAWYPLKGAASGYGKWQPNIGGVIYMIDEWDRTIILHFLYDAPHIASKMVVG